LLSVTGLRIGGLEGFLKRSLDLAVTLLLLPVVLPVCVAITLWLVAIRHVNPIARRQMIGDGRRRFTLYTFPPEAALRQLHIWRLPALINVVRGDLSLVGPRPIACALAVRYRAWSSMLACVRPGLTGPWWLLSGTRRLSIEAEVADDLSYIRNYSIWLDLHILARTARKLSSRLELSELDAETLGQPTDIVAPTRASTPEAL
jgi:lipopolysaccharide/colanic/teichoic acid biosynthesis glycosyltransferase